MKTMIGRLVGGAFACLAVVAVAAEPIDDRQLEDLKALGSKTLGIHWAGRLHGGSERDVVAVTDGVTTLTVRKDFRTFIVHNSRATRARDPTGFTGSADEYKRIGLKALGAIHVERSEIARVRVLQQYSRAAYQARAGTKPRLGAIHADRRTLLVTRQVDKVPVISSLLVLDLDREGRIAFMELVWPPITPAVREEARRLQALMADKYRPPPIESASVESADVVILHSPAVSFETDMVAAVRVIYRPEDGRMGKKPVRYLDAEGHDVPSPRQLELPVEEKLERPASEASHDTTAN